MNNLVSNTQHPLVQVNLETLADKSPLWLKTMRHHALERFNAMGLPTIRQDDWKYTKITPLTQHRYSAPSESQASSEQIASLTIPDLECYTLIFSDGQYQAELSNLSSLPSGVICCSLSEAVTQHATILEQYLGKIADVNKHGFQALNIAYMQNGYFLYIPNNIVLNKPIRIVFLATEQNTATTYQLRNLIVANSNSCATVIEHYQGNAVQPYWTNTITEIHLAASAQLEHYKIQQESNTAYHIGTVSVEQHAHSQFKSHSFALGGRLVRSDTDIHQAAEHIHSVLNGLYIVNGKQHVDHHTRIEHAQPHGSSRELYKGIITEQGRGVFNGKVIVQQDAQKIDAAQTNKNLLLSAHAEIDTKPELEIYADDVRCAHGATVGQLDAGQLFYLRTRGLDEHTARNLIIYAFAAELIEVVSLQPLRAYLRHAILQKLGQDTSLLEV